MHGPFKIPGLVMDRGRGVPMRAARLRSDKNLEPLFHFSYRSRWLTGRQYASFRSRSVSRNGRIIAMSSTKTKIIGYVQAKARRWSTPVIRVPANGPGLQNEANARLFSLGPLVDHVDTLVELFDARWYMWRYPDCPADPAAAFPHYLLYARSELRQPNPLVDFTWYAQRNPDVKADGINLLDHFIIYGLPEGRAASPLFDSKWYAEHHADVRESKKHPFLHFLTIGAKLKYDPNPFFNSRWYIERNIHSELADEYAASHYLRLGAWLGRDPGPLFSGREYLLRNPDIVYEGVDPLSHYLTIGQAECRVVSRSQQ